MKRYLLKFFLLFFLICISLNGVLFASAPTSYNPVASPLSTAQFRWRYDRDAVLDGANVDMNWMTTLNQLVIPTAELSPVYRIRIGQNFTVKVPLTGSGYEGTYANISQFGVKTPISFIASYKEDGSSSSYKQIPTSINAIDPIYMRPSAYGIADATTIDYHEETGRKVLPAYNESGRPANPYYFIGGKYYGRASSSSDIGSLPTYTDKVHTITSDPFLSSTGSQVYVSPQKYINFGIEIEASIGFSTAVKPNTLYDINIHIEVPITGTGYTDTWGSGNTRTLSSYIMKSDFSGSFKTPAKVLPVSLKSFIATKQGTSALLNWVTASEINNKGFYVQRSTDGKTFSNLGFVSSLASGGNSNTILNYSYTDATPGTGAVYYRLNQIDLDGTSKYSDIQSLFMGASSADVMVAPNPVASNVNLNNAQVGADYAIYSMSGQLVKSGKVTSSVMSIDASNLASGMYVIKTSTNAGAPVFKKFIKK